ncbi:MAG TPA: Gfo/Idh/MocA family oxidoreductase [Prolixibacteraceae bacterium]|nr:Gfo/Idh/MocA family oxidoreductase [Prolixibacteraceae bacterium]
MKNKIRWGVLSTAKIGREKVIPGIQKGSNCTVDAICSRNLEQATATAKLLNISKAYGSYEELLNDPEIDAVYIPLPNNMHVEWAIKAMQAGKHVLCEKPIGVSAAEALSLLQEAQKYPQLKVMEAFMYRFHPQWQKVKSLIADDVIGELKAVQSHFSYFNIDPKNIRNSLAAAGGALMDIGCYCVSFSRFLFNEEPTRVVSCIDHDPQWKTDRLTSAMLDFGDGKISTFTCSTQLMPYQRVNIFGTNGHIEIEIPVNAPKDASSKIWVRTKTGSEEIIIEAVDQYTIQAESFAKAILNDSPVSTDLMDAVNNMKVIEAIFKSSKQNGWEIIG